MRAALRHNRPHNLVPFAIVPIRRLSTLQSLRVDFQKISNYWTTRQDPAIGFYYVTRDTGDPKVWLRARGLIHSGKSCYRFRCWMHVGLDKSSTVFPSQTKQS